MTRPLAGLTAIALDELHPSPNNPRERLTDIAGLANSITEVGMIQPIIVQRIPGQPGFQIVAGHRRHAAAVKLGWRDAPCIVRRDMLPDEELLAMLVENGQRTDLDPIEEARALNRLHQGGMSQAAIGVKIGRSIAHVSNRLRLLSLTPEQQEEVRAGVTTITSGIDQAKVASGHTGKRSKPADRAWHFAHTHDLALLAKGRCSRLGHKAGRRVSGGMACGECWESVIRADERKHLHDVSDQRGRCVLCDTAQDHAQAVGL